ncbi:MAG: hypothetical protein LZF61_01390 [Nitrosomonas sp.]|nr:MAG: hypothetical protein LZF61_01390 [Nitrosomonas sp.]
MQRSNNNRHFVLIVLRVLSVAVSVFFAVNATAKTGEFPLIADGRDLQEELAVVKLNDIIDSIKQQEKIIEMKLQSLARAKTDQEKNKIQDDLSRLADAIHEQESSFELIMTAGLELSNDDTGVSQRFDWKKDLLEIVQPILGELRQLTEKKRKLDFLQKKIDFYNKQIGNINEVLAHISGINKYGLEKSALLEFERIEKKWQDQLQDNNHLLEVAQLQLDEMVKSQSAKEISLGEHIAQFASGRGATLFMAIAAFIAVYFSMLLLLKLLGWVSRQQDDEKRTYYQRIITLFYHFLMGVLAVAAVFYVLNVRNDQALIGITVLLLVSIIWLLKSSIPSFVNELRMLLNTGSVREGECIVYNGIPMRVESLNYYSKLVNPMLPGLELRLTLGELANYISRPYSADQPWFPCRIGDFVKLSDDTFGMVKCITLENIVISAADGLMPRTYSIADFLAANPKNYSQGFTVFSEFGVDYRHQMLATTVIPEILCAGIRQGLLQQPFGSALTDLNVHFAKANVSSLDYQIIAGFDGSAARDYFAIRRALQRYAVEVCNQQQWTIPFTQIVVHQGNNQRIEETSP